MSTGIFFRVEREGRWGPVALEDLTTEEVVRLVVVARAPEVTADLLIRLARRVQGETLPLAVCDVLNEREAQDKEWGEQNHALPHWMLILGEEVGEANKAVLEYGVANRDRPDVVHEDKREAARVELVQVAAVAVAIVECMDRQETARREGREG